MKKIFFILICLFFVLGSFAYAATQSTTESVWERTLWPKTFTPSDFKTSPVITLESEDLYVDTNPVTVEGTLTSEVWYKSFDPSDFKPEKNITIESE